MKFLSPLEMMYKWESESPNKVYLRQPINDEWHEWTWKQFATEVRKMGAYLKSLDLPANSKIAVLSKNCAHWMMADLAIMMSGHVSVPMYPNLNSETVRQILEHSEAKVLFAGKLDDYASMKPGVPTDVKCITFPFYAQPGYDLWDDLVKEVEPLTENVVRDPMDLATIIYTSGTTGMPKGVMHKFYNFSWSTTKALQVIPMPQSTKFFSYLPLCHIAERFLVQMGSMYSGGMVSFAESLEKFPQNLQETQPTIFLGVPRIWTKFQQGVLTKMPQKKLNLFLKIPILSGIVKKKIQTALGLREANLVFTGAAPTPASLISWYQKLGINIQEAYAMTENCCYSHVTLPDHIKVGCVGKALPDCEVKLSEQNEILVKHPALMDGYYKEPEMTAETIRNGYLHTGDEGAIDSEGFLKITGRVKDLFKTSKGKYVAPAPIELKLEANADIEQVCLVGDGIPQPIVLAVLSESAGSKSKDEIASSLANSVQTLNPNLDHHEQVKRVVVMKEAWTVENGLLTPTMKIKRNALEKIHRHNYEGWYEQVDEVVWE